MTFILQDLGKKVGKYPQEKKQKFNKTLVFMSKDGLIFYFTLTVPCIQQVVISI